MTTCATSHLDPPHDIAQLIFSRPSKEMELLKFQMMGLTYTYFRLHYFFCMTCLKLAEVA